MKKIQILTISLLLASVCFTSCGSQHTESKLDMYNKKQNSSLSEIVTTTAPTSIPDRYTTTKYGYIKPEDESSDTSSEIVTHQKYQKYAYWNGSQTLYYYDLFDGPHDWEGVHIKFTTPEDLYLTIESDMPVLYTHDIDDVDVWPKTIDGEVNFYPYYLQQRNMKFDDVDKEFCDSIAEVKYKYARKVGKDFSEIETSFEDCGDYILFSFLFDKTVDDQEIVITYCFMNNGSMIETHVKKGSEYEKIYKDDLKKIVDTFEYSDIGYVP